LKDENQKALAVILAVVMTITLIPSMAFASTTNVVSNVTTFSKTDGVTSTLELKISNAVDTWTEKLMLL